MIDDTAARERTVDGDTPTGDDDARYRRVAEVVVTQLVPAREQPLPEPGLATDPGGLRLVDDLGVDALGFADLIAVLESMAGATLASGTIDEIVTVADLAYYLHLFSSGDAPAAAAAPPSMSSPLFSAGW